MLPIDYKLIRGTNVNKLLIFILLPYTILAGQRVLTYPNINGQGKESINYAILNLALEKSGKDYNVVQLQYKVNDVTQRTMLEEGKIDIADFGTSKEWEEKFLPVYFPIDLGLNGWRLLFLHRDNGDLFSNVKSLDQLRKYKTGLGENWADIKIFEDSGITVLQAPQISNLMAMLNNKRFDYFSLSAQNSFWNLNYYKKDYPDLVLDEYIVMIYPFARFFFLRKSDTELRDTLLRGLITAYKDGSLLQLYKTHPFSRDLFLKANLKERVQIRLPNRETTPEFNTIPKEYFFSISMLD